MAIWFLVGCLLGCLACMAGSWFFEVHPIKFTRKQWWVVFRSKRSGRITWASSNSYDNEIEAQLSSAKCIPLADLKVETVDVFHGTRAQLQYQWEPPHECEVCHTPMAEPRLGGWVCSVGCNVAMGI